MFRRLFVILATCTHVPGNWHLYLLRRLNRTSGWGRDLRSTACVLLTNQLPNMYVMLLHAHCDGPAVSAAMYVVRTTLQTQLRTHATQRNLTVAAEHNAAAAPPQWTLGSEVHA